MSYDSLPLNVSSSSDPDLRFLVSHGSLLTQTSALRKAVELGLVHRKYSFTGSGPWGLKIALFIADFRRLLGDLVRPLQSHVARLRTAGKGPSRREVPQSGNQRVAGKTLHHHVCCRLFIGI